MPHIPMLYQLSYREFTLRVIEAHLGFLTAPTFHIGTQEYSLVSRHYREYYLNWLAAVGVNKQSIQRHSQGLQAGLDCWRNGYLQMYLYFDDSFLRDNYNWRLPTGLEIGILWYARRTPSTIYATAKAIIQLCPHSPTAPLPDFQSLSPKQKEGIYQYIEEKLKPRSVNHTVNSHHYTFAHEALAYGATGPDIQPRRDISYKVYGEEYWVYHLPVQMLVIATVCQYQVVASHSYTNFHSIDDLCQVLLDRYMERTGISGIEPWWKVYQDSSWEGGAPAFLRHIPASLFNKEPNNSPTGSLFDNYE
jgi:hypothetical protein